MNFSVTGHPRVYLKRICSLEPTQRLRKEQNMKLNNRSLKYGQKKVESNVMSKRTAEALRFNFLKKFMTNAVHIPAFNGITWDDCQQNSCGE